MRPFREHLVFMLFMFVVQLPYLYLQFFILKYTFNTALLAVHCILLAYLVTLLVGLIKNKAVRTVIQTIIVLLTGTLFAWNSYCLAEFNGILDEDYLMLILDTNVNEANEFLTSIVPKSFILGVGGVFLLFLALWLFSRRHPLRISNKLSIPIIVLLGLLAAVHINYWQIWQDGPVNHVSYLLSAIPKYELPDESELNSSNPSVAFLPGNELPADVVLIIGESFSRNHSSMYGYDKQTNPRLGALKDSTLLFTFDSIDAPDVNTSPAFKFMLSLFSKADTTGQAQKWYKYPNLLELMRVCGYDSYWYSNQACTGKFNSVARVFAKACDHVHFYQLEGPIGNNRVRDDVLIDSSYQDVRQLNSGHHFLVYHMMGSHFEYSMRYPDEYANFTPGDYKDRKASQRYTVATYDNSILFNDFVVEQIINMYRDKEAVVIYMPDHAQDMFDSSPDYFMHGKRHDPASCAAGIKIPFMVYATPLFQRHYPELMQRIKDRQEHPKPWNTDDLPYFIMDLIGVESINGEPVRPKSVL